MDEASLKKLVKAVRGLFKEFESVNFKDLSEKHTQKLIDDYMLESFHNYLKLLPPRDPGFRREGP